MSSIGATAKRARFVIRSHAANHALLHAPLRLYNARRDPAGQAYVDDDTEVLIDGFQGSANTFATRCFRHAQTTPVAIAHHCHAPEQVLEAVKRDLPVMVVLRQPLDATRSTLRRWPDVSARAALRAYERYHRRVAPVAAQVLIAPFEVVTRDFGEVTDVFNTRFDTSFDRFEHTEESARVGYDPPADRIDVIERDRAEAEARIHAVSANELAGPQAIYDELRGLAPWPVPDSE